MTRSNPFQQGGQTGAVTTYEYDSMGRIAKLTLPGGNITQTTYNGTTVTAINEVGQKDQTGGGRARQAHQGH